MDSTLRDVYYDPYNVAIHVDPYQVFRLCNGELDTSIVRGWKTLPVHVGCYLRYAISVLSRVHRHC
jgi:hypothetical protein